MSESDSFIREVQEEVRRDRMFKLWKRYGPFAIGAIAAIVAAAAVSAWLEQRARQEARALGGTFLAVERGDTEAATALVQQTDGPAELVALMRSALAEAREGETAAAVEDYRAAAAHPAATPPFADLALLNAARLEAGSRPPSEIVLELEPLTAPEAPYRLLALELRALMRLEAGETAAAHEDLAEILRAPAVTGQLATRARELMAATGGDPDAVRVN